MYKIRFHLAKGKNYLNWQVKYPSGAVRYYNPEEVTLILENAYLRNQIGTAKKIHDGANKTVCAWVEADSVTIREGVSKPSHRCVKVGYNPRVAPTWMIEGKNADKTRIEFVYTCGRTLFH